MKNLKYFILVTLGVVLGLSLLFQGCDKSDDDDNNNNTGYTISGVVEDPITGQPIAGATIQLLDQNYNPVLQITSDGTGKFTLSGMQKGDYLMKSVSSANYKEMFVPNVKVDETTQQKSNFVAFMPVPSYITVPTGAICGKVFDKDGNPVANANVSISAKEETLTNGYFASTKTDAQGQYKIGVISIESPVTGQKIPQFKIKSEKDGYVNVKNDVVIEENYLIVSNPSLVDKPNLGNVVFTDGFEGRSWTFTGFWHRQANASIINQAYTSNFVKLGVGDNSNGAIPSVYAGNYMAWFGEATTGNYMGEYDPLQGTLTGGNGIYTQWGYLTSDLINLNNVNQAALYFASWFEIESVNPDQSGYDIMEVWVLDAADTNNPVSLGRLNPYSDPVLDDRIAIPYTSGGFNAPGTWNVATFDLSAFAGKTIMIRFEFNTLDASYNGFRGWFIDDVTIRDKAPVGRSGYMPTYPSKPKPRS